MFQPFETLSNKVVNNEKMKIIKVFEIFRPATKGADAFVSFNFPCPKLNKRLFKPVLNFVKSLVILFQTRLSVYQVCKIEWMIL